MARYNYNLLDLNIDKLFEDHKIEEIVEIGKLLDAEIEKKRVELRSMVGDRYKDVLTASDAIKNMKTISEGIVENIQNITDTCEKLINFTSEDDLKTSVVDKDKVQERTLIIQIRLAIFINEEIWIALDKQDNLKAAQFYLLAQHIHIGLSLFPKEYLDKLPILLQIKTNLHTLKDIIFQRIREKLQSVEITAEETSSNLNALMLLENQNVHELLRIFIDNRITALNTVMNTSHESVRIQVSAMLRCLITTIHLLHDCFMCYKDYKKGLIWRQLENIIDDSSPPTLSQITLPSTPLITYIPDIIKQFRPKCKTITNGSANEATTVLKDWLQTTKLSVEDGLNNSFKLVTNVKGLYIIREEALKIELPEQWEVICTETNLPDNFDVWYYFFQKLLSSRAKELISKKINLILKDLQIDIANILNGVSKSGNSEIDLRWYTWTEETDDVSRLENEHAGLSMKTLGYSQNIVSLCEKLDSKYLELLIDVSQYLYGKEFDPNLEYNLNQVKLNDFKSKKKFIDREELENHLRIECINNSTQITIFLQDFLKSELHPELLVLKSLMCARFLQSVTNLCSNFRKCCLFNAAVDDWINICKHFMNASLQFWENWVNECVLNTDKEISKEIVKITACNMISILSRWDTIEIQEQTEENVFKSQIKVPLKPSLILQNILNKLNDDVSYILPHTLPKLIHIQYIERNVEKILSQYKKLFEQNLNQKQALQFLFDIKFLTTFCIPRENIQLVSISQEICDKLREKIDPFDLDVFYTYLQNNVKRAVIQSQVILGCLLPSTAQLANLGLQERSKEHEKEPSILALSIPSTTTWFPLLPITVPSQKTATVASVQKETKNFDAKPVKTTPKKSQDPATSMRSSAAAIFGGLTTDWFS